jgi:xylan 1,4-beta-xylosidase
MAQSFRIPKSCRCPSAALDSLVAKMEIILRKSTPKGSVMRKILTGLMFLLWASKPAWPQGLPRTVAIEVNYNKIDGTMPPVWSFFGYDEPNYSYAPNGRKLLRELSELGAAPVYVRVHNLLTSGDGSASLKWGSTNVYAEDAAGNAVYDWTILDRIFDVFAETGVKPLVELGFMPQPLSTHPEPYRHNFPQDSVAAIYTGWTYPPKDYEKWSELIFQVVRHLRARYGDRALKTWLWEVWNEPDIGYWHGTPEEYCKLYDFTAEAVLRAFPGAKIGGPDTTGAASPKAAEFLRLFLEHCTRQRNYAQAQVGSHLDFISFHPKGAPKWINDHVQMGITTELHSIEKGFEIVASDPLWRQIPILLGEWDPEGCAACSAMQYPQNAYRNGPLYATYTVEALLRTMDLAKEKQVHLMGLVTWAFEFENQPYFAGFRELASNGIDKPVLNAFRMLGLLGPERLAVKSSGAQETADVVTSGVRGPADVNVLAARQDREMEILVWNYHDDDLPAPDIPVDLLASGLPRDLRRVRVEDFRIDGTHSNAYALWKRLGSPESPSPAAYQELEAAGQLQLSGPPSLEPIENGTVRWRFSLPRPGLSLLRFRW